MASKKDMERQQRENGEITMESLMASLDRPIDTRVARGGYSQLSHFLQRRAARGE